MRRASGSSPSFEAYAMYYMGKLKMSEEAFRAYCDKRIAAVAGRTPRPTAWRSREACRARGIVLASHDDATIAHVEEAIEQGIRVAEFPTTAEAAAASKQAGLGVLMGAPNIMRGASHSGNVSARQLAADGLLDILSSDYIPFSLIQSAFFLGDAVETISLPQAVAMVSKNPAEAVGLDRSRRHRDRPARRSRACARRRPCACRPHRLARGTPRRMMVSALLEREQGKRPADPQRRLRRRGRPERRRQGHADRACAAALADEPQVEFVRRVITRPCDGETEDHDTLADAEFLEALADGAFALAWEAHGLRYGLPASVDRAIENGHVAVANVSRGALPALRQRYANVAVVEITADPEILAARLAGRGRESRGEVLARLARTVACDTTGTGHRARQQRAEGDRRRQARRHHPQGDGIRRCFGNGLSLRKLSLTLRS